jgi:hypothetical protein
VDSNPSIVQEVGLLAHEELGGGRFPGGGNPHVLITPFDPANPSPPNPQWYALGFTTAGFSQMSQGLQVFYTTTDCSGSPYVIAESAAPAVISASIVGDTVFYADSANAFGATGPLFSTRVVPNLSTCNNIFNGSTYQPITFSPGQLAAPMLQRPLTDFTQRSGGLTLTPPFKLMRR